MEKYFTIRNGRANIASTKNFSTCPLGTVLSFAGQTAPRGFLLCDGQSYAVAEYPDLYAVIGNTYGGDSTNFNVPNLIDKFIQGSNTSGTEKEAGLPNITGSIYGALAYPNIDNADGVFGKSNEQSYGTYGSGGGGISTINLSLNASKSNAIYGNSDTVQPPALTMVYIIKAFHTNEGTDSKNEVSDPIIEYVEGEIDALVSDEVSDSTVWSSKKTSDELATKKDAVKLLNNATNSTKWLKLTLGSSSTFQPIIISDQYGGKVEITGMANDSTYKPVKKIRYSYGDWTTYSATDYTLYDGVDPNYKIQRLFYYPTDGYYYLEIRQWTTIKVEGNSTAELVASLPVETSEMTLIPESNWGRIDDTSTKTSSTWSSSKIASTMPTTRSLTLSSGYSGYITEVYDPTTKVVVYNVNISGTFKGLLNSVADGFRVPKGSTSSSDVMHQTIGMYGSSSAMTGDAQFTRLLVRNYGNPHLEVDVNAENTVVSGTITYVTA